MSYIGNTTVNQNYVPAVDYFNGDGSTVAFTLSRPVASVAAVQAVISNVPQNPGSAFTVSGSTITFTSAPPSGTANIYVYYTSPNTQIVQPGQGTVGTTQLQSDLTLTNPTYTGTLTGGTGVVNIGSGQVYKDSYGNVGINTVPSYKLDVLGVVNAKSASAATIQLMSTDASSQANTIGSYANSGNIYSQLNHSASFYTWGISGTEKMRLDTGNNLLVGTTTSYGYSTNGCFGVVASNGSTIGLQPTASAGFSSRIWHPNASNVYIDNTGSATYVFSQGSGASYSTVTGIINNVSDYRLKENVVPIVNALDRIAALKPISYNFKSDVVPAMPWGTDTVDGFIAHEFGEVIVGGCNGEKDAVDENGEVKPQGVDMTRAIPLLVAAIQELKAEVDDLKAQLEAK